MKIRETSYFPSWIGRQTKLKPTNRAHILDIFNTYYGNRVKSDSIVFHRGSFNCGVEGICITGVKRMQNDDSTGFFLFVNANPLFRTCPHLQPILDMLETLNFS